LAELPGSDQSLRQLRSYFKYADDFTGANASKNNFLQEFSKYKIIQLYTHAFSNSAAGEPVIYFADSALYLSDLFNGKSPATRLVMLSACETAKGKFYQGEGIFSFSRGFAEIGIPSSITNLWSVENKSTYHLTELFYKYLSKGLSPDIALQSAKREFIVTASREKRMPYFWAAAILIGKTDKIELKKTFPWTPILLFAGVITLCFLGWNRVTRAKRHNRF
jgi:CHAT domain-containing protein